MGKYKYITNRTLPDKTGKETGFVKVLVPSDSDTASVSYKCPECLFEEKREQPWERPFNIRCGKCGMIIKLPKLKEQIKKEKKAEKAAKEKEAKEAALRK